MAVFSKILKKTDIEKRLCVPSAKKQCFLNFGGQHKVEFKAKDKNGRVWTFGGSIRKKGKYPKPVLSRGWVQFVASWELEVGDEVILSEKRDKAGKWFYRIEVNKSANQPSGVPPPPLQSHGSDRTTEVATHSNIEDEPTLTSHSTDQPITYDQTEGLRNQPVGSEFGFICPKPLMQVREYDQTEGLRNQPLGSEFGFICPKPLMQVRELKFIDFLGLESQPSFPSLYHMVQSPITSLPTPGFLEFL